MKKERMIEELARIEFGDTFKKMHYDDYNMIWVAESIVGMTLERDYFLDHNALQRIIDGMDDNRIDLMAMYLSDALSSGFFGHLLKATCEQKAEAILRAYGEWEEG